MRVYYTTCDGGDGSASVWFLESRECIDLLEEKDPEGFGMGEGGGFFELHHGTEISGIKIETLQDCKDHCALMFGDDEDEDLED